MRDASSYLRPTWMARLAHEAMRWPFLRPNSALRRVMVRLRRKMVLGDPAGHRQWRRLRSARHRQRTEFSIWGRRPITHSRSHPEIRKPSSRLDLWCAGRRCQRQGEWVQDRRRFFPQKHDTWTDLKFGVPGTRPTSAPRLTRLPRVRPFSGPPNGGGTDPLNYPTTYSNYPGQTSIRSAAARYPPTSGMGHPPQLAA